MDWFLSIDGERMLKHINLNKNPSYRSISINHNEVDFSGGFENLHTLSYEKILLGEGFRIEDNRPAIEIVDRIRNSEVTEEISLKKTHDFNKMSKSKYYNHPSAVIDKGASIGAETKITLVTYLLEQKLVKALALVKTFILLIM